MWHPDHLPRKSDEEYAHDCRCGCGERWTAHSVYEGDTGAHYYEREPKCPSCGDEAMFIDGEMQDGADYALDAMSTDARSMLAGIIEEWEHDDVEISYDKNDPHTAPTESTAYLDYGYGVRLKITLEHPSAGGE